MRIREAVERIRQMLKKEFIQTLRDPHTRWLLFGPALIQMFVFGYAATMEIKHVSMAVLDQDNTQESRELISHFSGSSYFHVSKYVARRDDLREGIDRGDFLIAVEIDSGFAQRLRSGQGASVQVIVDSSNSNTALVALGYLSQVGATFAQDYQLDRLRRVAPQTMSFVPEVNLVARPWFNEGLLSEWYFVPGVLGNLMLILIMNLTAFAVVREREIGTLEQVMVTPIRRWEFIVGKTVPFFLIGCFDATMLALVGTLWFGVPLRGHIAVLAVGVMLFLLAALGLGLLLSTLARTQQQSMITAFFFTMPMTSLSGFGTPISSMPLFFQRLSYFNPLRHVVLILRSIFLKGVGLDVLWPNLLVMAVFAGLTLTVSVLRFRKSIE
ncbi:MAG TPA: ABC transporter permease [Verrucomicrobiae bacterium]|nr:ABC transporter permease [Verrucomicrobiae bacterium]